MWIWYLITYNLLNLSLSCNLSKKMDVVFGIDNLLNTEDLDVYGNGWCVNNLSDEEDIGLDLCPDIY